MGLKDRVIIKITGDDTEFRNKMSGIGDVAKKGFKIFAAAAAAASIATIKSIADLAEETREYRNDIATLTTSFETAGFSAKEAKDVYKDFYSFLGEDDRSVEAANHLAKFCDNQKDLATWTTITTGIWSQYQDSLPIEGLTEAANETIKVGKVTGVMADALNWASDRMHVSSEMWSASMANNKEAQAAFNKAIAEGLPVEDAFNAALATCSTEQERQQLLTKSLNDIYSESADIYRENAASVLDANRAQAEHQELLASIGEKVEPIMTGLKMGWNSVLEALLDLVDGVDIVGYGQKLADAFQGFAEDMLPKIIDGIGTFLSIASDLAPVIAGFAGVVASLKLGAFIGDAADAAKGAIDGTKAALDIFTKGGSVATVMMSEFGAAQKVASTMIALCTGKIKLAEVAQWAWNAAMSANPIGIIIVAIVAFIAIIVVLWKKCDWFREMILGLWNKIKAKFEEIKPFLEEVWNAITDIFSEAIGVVVDLFKSAWDKIKEVWDVVSPYFAELWEMIKLIFSVVEAVLGAYFRGAWAAIKFVWDLVSPYFQFLWETIKKIFSVVAEVLGGFFSAAWEAIKFIWDIVGPYFRALWNTIKTIFSVVAAVLGGNFGDAVKAIKSWWNSMVQYFSDIWEGIKKVFAGIVDFFREKFRDAYNTVSEFFTLENFKKIFHDSIVGGLEAIIEDVKNAAGKVRKAIDDAFAKAVEVVFGFVGGGDGGTDYGQNKKGSISPFSSASISSDYGWRTHPITKKKKMHYGIDFAAPKDTPIQSVCPGRVYRVAYEPKGFGNLVVIQDKAGRLHYYGHMSRSIAKPGAYVMRGTRIGYVGSTGLSTGPHLHYGVKSGGGWVNPHPYCGYATGGFPAPGELFFANEEGIEMMGKMGKRNVIANNMQIIEGIKTGISSGMIAASRARSSGNKSYSTNITQNMHFYKENVSPSETKRAARRGAKSALAGGVT